LPRHQKLQALGLEEVLNWTETAPNRVEHGPFFSNFEERHAVQYFYEPFLAAYDPVLRKRMGVWFTPPEIVGYMVTRIDHVLKTQLGVANGFADPNVFVLDPACGTGAFLVEVLRHIEAQLKTEGAELAPDNVRAPRWSASSDLKFSPHHSWYHTCNSASCCRTWALRSPRHCMSASEST
jgi:hypothetical protein